MGDQKPYADRLADEVDAFSRLWRNRRWLAILFIIVFLVIGAYGFYGWWRGANALQKLKVRNEELKSESAELRRDIRQLQTENAGLRETVAPLIARASEDFPGEEVSEALKKIVSKLEEQDPLAAPIASVSSSVEVLITTDTQVSKNTHYFDRGGYLLFGKGKDRLLATSATDSFANPGASGQVLYSAVFQMKADDTAVGQATRFLKNTEYLQIMFAQMPRNSEVIRGKAVVVINGSRRFEFEIKPQKMQEEKIFIRELSAFRSSVDH